MAHVGKPPRGDVALVKRNDSRDAQKRGPEVPRRIKAAAELLTGQPGKLDYQALAVQLGYRDARALRKALALPQTVRFLQEFKRDMLQKINMGNPEALRAVRDTSDNAMARVQAVRTLEGMGDAMDAQHGGRSAPPAPGVVIVIEQRDGSTTTIGPPVVEARPDEFRPAVD